MIKNRKSNLKVGFNTGYLKKIIEGVKKSIANGDEVTCTQLNEIVSVPRSGYPAVNEFRPTGRKSIIIRINGGDKKQELENLLKEFNQ